jgi:transcriptional regulator with XRE-family HTH domain
MAIGDRIKEMRLRKGQSLQQVADGIGASKAHIWELESNRSKNPSIELLQKLADHFKTTVMYLVEEPQGDLTRADQFYRRNSGKLATLDDKNLEVLENLLDMISNKNERNDD